MQLYFIRHGQSVNNAGYDQPGYQEHQDPYLTEIGKEQARITAQFLKENQIIRDANSWNSQNQHGYGVTRIYTSLMERAVDTSAQIARALENVPYSAWVDIHEEGGIYAREEKDRYSGRPGRPRSFYEQNFPELSLPDGYDESGWWNRPFEEEPERQPRADKVLAELLERHGDKDGQPEERIVFVSHGGFFMRFVSAVLKLPWRQGALGLRSWLFMNNCGITRFEFGTDYAMMLYMNKTSHLPAELITG